MTWPKNQTYRNHVYYLFRAKKRNKKKKKRVRKFECDCVQYGWLEKMSNLMIFSLASARKKCCLLWRMIQAFSFAFFVPCFYFFRSSTRFDSLCSVSYLPRFDHSLCSFLSSVARLENYFCNEIWYLYQQKKKKTTRILFSFCAIV